MLKPGMFVQLGGGVGRYMGSGSKRKVNVRVGEDVLSRLWSRVQTNNGIMVGTRCLFSFHFVPRNEGIWYQVILCKLNFNIQSF